MPGELKALNWVFPIGAILTIGGVFLYGLVERLSFGNTRVWWFSLLSETFFPALLIGSVLAIVGSFIERKRLLVKETRFRGIVCWAASAIAFLIFAMTGNVHGWTFTLIFPAFIGFVVGAVLLSKLGPGAPSA